jgi:hypothetical protein
MTIKAQRLAIRGRVQGVDAFASWCRRGPPLARGADVALRADAAVGRVAPHFETRPTD